MWDYQIVNNDAMVKGMVIYENRNIVTCSKNLNSIEITYSDHHTI